MVILCVMLDDSVIGQLPALQKDSAVHWMTKESSINLWLGKVHLQRFQISEATPASYLVPTAVKAAGQGSKSTLSSARIKNVVICAILPHPSILTYSMVQSPS
jgi:hypothetical protein